MPDILFILILALIIFGPKRLPEVARQVAKFMAQFRVMRDDLKRQLEHELLKIEMEEKTKAAAPKQLQPSAQAAEPVEASQSPASQNSPLTPA